MKEDPVVSVIIPFYNLESCASYCLNSVLNQTFEKIEVICVDDGSKDETLRILHTYEQKDSRVVVYCQENAGQARARNKGVELAKGKYVTFVDGDDFVAPSYIEKLLEGINNEGCSLAIVNYGDIAYENLALTRMPYGDTASFAWRNVSVSELLYRDLISSCWGRIANKELFVDNQFCQRYYEDVEVGAKYIRDSKKIFFLESPLYFHVRRPGSTVNVAKASLQQVREYVTALERQEADLLEIGADAGPTMYCLSLHWSRVYKLATRAADCIEVREIKRRAIAEVRLRLITVLRDNNAPTMNRIRLLILSVLPKLYCSLFDTFVSIKNMLVRRGIWV